MWIKVCGMTTPEAVAAALEAGVDAIGFVFADSRRRVSPDAAAQLAAPARGRALCIAVTRHPEQSAVDEILAVFRPDCLQTDADDLRALRLPPGFEVLPVVRAGGVEPEVLPARLLFEGPSSGAGVPADWQAACALARRAQLILAGGLSAENVAAAVAEVRPFGVDVSSGVEAAPGVKSPQKIMSFVRHARAALRSVEDFARAQESGT